MKETNNIDTIGPLLPVNKAIPTNSIEKKILNLILCGKNKIIIDPKHNHLESIIGPPPSIPVLPIRNTSI